MNDGQNNDKDKDSIEEEGDERIGSNKSPMSALEIKKEHEKQIHYQTCTMSLKE